MPGKDAAAGSVLRFAARSALIQSVTGEANGSAWSDEYETER